MTTFLQTFLNGLSVGSFYALIALGYTMVYGILKFINFAHANVFMIGAWMSFVFARMMGWTNPEAMPPFYAVPLILVATMVFCGALGVLIEKLAYAPLRGAPRLNYLITAIGVSLFLENFCQLENTSLLGFEFSIFGTQPQRMPTLISEDALFMIGNVRVLLVDVLVMSITVILMVILEIMVFRTNLGRAMRAVSENPQTAALMGISPNRVIGFTFLTGSALAAAAGFLYATKYPGLNQPADSTWVLLGLKAFVAAVVGGIGNIQGAVVGGLLIGMVEMFGAAYLTPDLRDVYVFSILIFVLLVKPTGIFGKVVAEKV